MEALWEQPQSRCRWGPPRVPSGTITLADAEQEAFVAGLTEHAGNVPALAQALGVSRGTVYNKLRKLDLDLGSRPGAASQKRRVRGLAGRGLRSRPGSV